MIEEERRRIESLERETRFLSRTDDDLELRVDDGESGPVLVGYGAVFNRWSQPIYDMFRERIRPGAFAKTLSESKDITSYIDHEHQRILARTSAGNLKLEEDKKGLRYRIQLGKQSYVEDLVENVRSGNIRGSSFQFRAVKQEWGFAQKKGQLDERDLIEVKLFETGPVVNPAYTSASVSLRSALVGFDALLLQPDDLTEEDQVQIRSAISRLQSLLPKLTEPDQDHSDDSKPDERDHLLARANAQIAIAQSLRLRG